MNEPLIAISFLTIAAILFLTAVRVPEYRGVTVGAGALTLMLAGYAGWLAWSASSRPVAAPSTPTGSERLITIHGFGAPPPVPGQPVVSGDETPEEIVAKLGCGVCHQIPGIVTARTGVEGPLLIARVTAARRLASPEYQAAVAAGRAQARTPMEYLVESILRPGAFVVPAFELPERPFESAMPGHFGGTFTPAGLEKLADYLLGQDCAAARRDGLTGPRMEPIESLCGALGSG